jgi:ABC-2 type transport system ATP-binding protein
MAPQHASRPDFRAEVPSPVISVKDVGIQFSRSRRRRLSVREMVLKGRSTSPRGTFWALRNISFEIQPGEAVGLLGGNGSGKSTLLKILSGVLLPDEGSVAIRAGVAPLIELTGGFSGDLTARENIYLAGGLHGLSKAQVDERFDEIVEFAEIESFLDTPFRHFSSGMQVRLGFAVITTLEEPIVLVDEVLAVGDRRFRDKCFARMDDMLGNGQTLFLVSHSENKLRRFASRGLYLRRGALVGDGPIDEVLDQYHRDSEVQE